MISSRANYGSVRSVLKAIDQSANLELQIVLSASALLDQYGEVESDLKNLGLEVSDKVFCLLEGETPATMAKSTGMALVELPTVFERLKPDVVFVIGDRFEIMATAIAATYMNICLAHSMGGEVTGTIDESVRHAVTKMAHIHFAASSEARDRIIRLGEDPSSAHLVGCPRIDSVNEVINDARIFLRLKDLVASQGVGSPVDLDRPFIVFSLHPVTTEYDRNAEYIWESIRALQFIDIQIIVLWPNSDAGSSKVARELRKWRESGVSNNVRFFKNFPVDCYMALLSRTSCLVGNSSSGIREGAYIGTPVVNIGSRQNARARGINVIDVPPEKEAILSAVTRQIRVGRYESDPLYGDGRAAEKIVAILEKPLPSIQKVIRY